MKGTFRERRNQMTAQVAFLHFCLDGRESGSNAAYSRRSLSPVMGLGSQYNLPIVRNREIAIKAVEVTVSPRACPGPPTVISFGVML